MRSLLLTSLALLLACGGAPVPPVQDAGTEQPLGCQDELTSATVLVLDAIGLPVAGATVQATHLATGYTQVGTTDAKGVATSVTEDIGQGTVEVRAVHGSKVSDSARLEFLCDDCTCTVTPQSITLHFAE